MKRFWKKIFRSSLYLLKVLIQMVAKFFKFAVGQLLFEIFLSIPIIGFSYLFSSWGLPLHIALVLANAITFLMTLSLWFVVTYLFFEQNSSSRAKSEIKLAQKISRALSKSTSTQWQEYQDWLHDILLARRQLLDAKCPQWKVKLITYRRLSMFCIVVGISKVKQAATSIRRSR